MNVTGSTLRWPRLRAAWNFGPAASPRTGGFETRPYPRQTARRPVRPVWIPAFAGMTEGLTGGYEIRPYRRQAAAR